MISKDLMQKVSMIQAKRQPFIHWEQEQLAIAMLKAAWDANKKADRVKKSDPTNKWEVTPP